MKKRIKIVLIILLSLIILLFAVYWAFVFWLTSPKVIAKSDVPLEYTLNGVGYQDGIIIQDIIVEGNSHYLSLFNTKAVVTFKIKGQLLPMHGNKPAIKSVQLSEKWIKETFNGNNIGEITLVPIISYTKDKSYKYDIVNFDITIQDYIPTNGYGENKYRIYCLDRQTELILNQGK